ncbi:MAG: trehalose-phosphatase [Candidatus Omnitrophica bacterium]|nr:trehalose-phosphatase [Candidatus Omnitrophota bacterium]
MEYVFSKHSLLLKKIKSVPIFLFLDFDGTLAEIVALPSKARLAKKTKELLDRLALKKDFKIAVISGRSLKDIKKRVGIKNIIYAGNHGLEIEGPKIKYIFSVAGQYRKLLLKIKSDLEERLSKFKGVLIEDKGLSLSLHFRMIHKELVSKIKTIFHEATITYNVKGQIKVSPGKKVLEIRPNVDWDKGKVVLWLLARQVFSLKGKPVVPVYIGDDLTDEDAFRALKNKGITIAIGRKKRSFADYYLLNSREVPILLKKILLQQG